MFIKHDQEFRSIRLHSLALQECYRLVILSQILYMYGVLIFCYNSILFQGIMQIVRAIKILFSKGLRALFLSTGLVFEDVLISDIAFRF